MNNPFTRFPIDNSDKLIGRTRLLEKLKSKLNDGPILFFGGHQSGKTSVLKCFFSENKENKDEKWIYWDAQSFDTDEGLKGILKQKNLFPLDRIIESYKKFVLIIDEFDILGVSDTKFSKGDFENLASLIRKYRNRFIIIASSSLTFTKLKNEIKMHGSHILPLFATFKLTALEVSSNAEYYEKYLKVNDCEELYKSKKNLFDKAGQWAGIHPSLLQLAGDAVFNAENEEEYFENIREKNEDITDWGNKSINSLEDWERMQLYLNTMVKIKLERNTFEPLGFIGNDILPGAFEILIMNWFADYLRENPFLKENEIEKVKKEFIGKKFNEISMYKYYELIQLINDKYVTIDKDEMIRG